jgi:hypothetical protein
VTYKCAHSHSVTARRRAGRGRGAGVSVEKEDQVLLTHDRFAETWATVSSYMKLSGGPADTATGNACLGGQALHDTLHSFNECLRTHGRPKHMRTIPCILAGP